MRVTLKIGAAVIHSANGYLNETKARALALALLDMSPLTWAYDAPSKTWTSGTHTIQITES